MFKILLVEDEVKVHAILNQYFVNENYIIEIAETGEEGLELFNTFQPDLIVLDLMLPDLNGEYICKYIRSISSCPIIMLTAKASEKDRIAGFELGADDYLVKPFSPKELLLRVRSVLKRVYKVDDKASASYDSGRLVIQLKDNSVIVNRIVSNLTPIEYKLLELFMKHPHQVFPREQLIEQALGFDFAGYDRTIDAHVKNLRKKIEATPKSPTLIVTVFGAGYKWVGEQDG